MGMGSPEQESHRPSQQQGLQKWSRLMCKTFPLCLVSPPAPRSCDSMVFAWDKGTPILFHGTFLQVLLSAGNTSTPPTRVSPAHCAARISHGKISRGEPFTETTSCTLSPRPSCRPQPWHSCIARPEHIWAFCSSLFTQMGRENDQFSGMTSVLGIARETDQ